MLGALFADYRVNVFGIFLACHEPCQCFAELGALWVGPVHYSLKKPLAEIDSTCAELAQGRVSWQRC